MNRASSPPWPLIGESVTTDAQAARQVRLRQLAVQNYQFVWRILRAMGVSPNGVDDAAQKVFVVVTEKVDLIAAGAERSFLFQTALRVAMSVRRDHAQLREVSDNDLLLEYKDNAPAPDEHTEDRIHRLFLDRVLDSLSSDLRAVFVLFELEGLSSLEIAPMLNIPVGTVASRLRRAREEFHAAARRLQSRLERGGAP